MSISIERQLELAVRNDIILTAYRDTDLSKAEIAKQVGVSSSCVHDVLQVNMTSGERNKHKHRRYADSKRGNRNPMLGKVREQHHSYKGVVSDGKGYLMVLKPDWYTGRKGCKHVFQHHVVMCEALGISAIPAGFHVHHIDNVPKNNSIDNLALLPAAAHRRLHARERATTIPQGSKTVAAV